MPEAVKTWWTLSDIVDWFREADPNASILSICSAVKELCEAGRVRARGRRRIYNWDRFPKLSHTDPGFVGLSEEYSYINPTLEQISTGEWRDLAFFARPVPKAGEAYLIGFAGALEELSSPIELRSNSKHRLAWVDVEFSQGDRLPTRSSVGRYARRRSLRCRCRESYRVRCRLVQNSRGSRRQPSPRASRWDAAPADCRPCRNGRRSSPRGNAIHCCDCGQTGPAGHCCGARQSRV